MSIMRVAVIDDDPEVCRVIHEVLFGEGVQVAATCDFAGGSTFIEQQGVDAAFIDLRAPQRPGLPLVAELRRRGCQTPVIFMTATASFDSAVEALRLGAVDYLIKPLTAQGIVQALSRAAVAQRRIKARRPQPEPAKKPSPTLLALDDAHAFGCDEEAEGTRQATVTGSSIAGGAPTIQVRLEGDLRAIERQIIREVIRSCDGNKAAAARQLGLHRKTLYRLLQADEVALASC
ncbi:MAG: response regulator [Pirellulales bacterium]|nr:response regulator [Pirellulales bacterium]